MPAYWRAEGVLCELGPPWGASRERTAPTRAELRSREARESERGESARVFRCGFCSVLAHKIFDFVIEEEGEEGGAIQFARLQIKKNNVFSVTPSSFFGRAARALWMAKA